ncbi:uncharacterized protein BXZ73DRAFT_75645 [Epithele typhae]|uniref:uncharacterized protein n=1 Tax=Epithele typhae TaxID=378194 RepID=UPI0020086726|nr:uncharacterized protein BXZ73DRAFT_75645 [Epithele typhae]KAH9940014.1 hypothetical protein BXZ73DRAFT_75645 [Epithele typhae]
MPLPAADALLFCPTREEIRRRIGEIEAGVVEKRGASGLTTALEEGMRRLYTDWNSTLSINRLPTEILLRLFAACFQPARPVSDELPKRTHRRRKLLLLVCRKWRDLIEATPTLWSFITPHMPPHLYTLVLSLAREVNVDISFQREPRSLWIGSISPDLAPLPLPQEDMQQLNDTADSEDDGVSGKGEDEGDFTHNLSSELPWIVEDDDSYSALWSEAAGMAIAAESCRTSALVLSDDDVRRCYSLPFLETIFRDRAWPTLEELCIDFIMIETLDSVSSILCLTRACFPRLRHLELEGMILPIEPTLFPLLRSLRLSGPTMQWPPLEDLLICLSSARYLEDLSLSPDRGGWTEEALRVPHYPPPTSPVRLPLELPHLRFLCLQSNNNDDLIPLLRALPLVRPITLDFLCISNEDWRQVTRPNPESGRSLSILDAFFPTRAPDEMPLPIPPSVRKLESCVSKFTGSSVNDRDGGTLGRTRLFSWSAAPYGEDDSDDGNNINIENSYGLSNAIDDVLTLFRHIPLTQLNLVIFESVHLADGRWDEIFGTFPALEYLHLSGGGTPIALLRALTPSSDGSTAPCPALESLKYDVTVIDEVDAQESLQAMIHCLHARAACGMRPLGALDICTNVRVLGERSGEVDARSFLAQMREMVAGEVKFEYEAVPVT